MQAPKYIENNILVLTERARDMLCHKQKLKLIKQRSEAQQQARQVTAALEYKRAMQKQSRKFETQQRNEKVNRTNQILLNRLVDISQGGGLSVPLHSVSQQSSPALLVVSTANARSASQFRSVRSLNYISRKHETDRIERENHDFAKRLFTNCGATISKVQQDDSYQALQQIKQRIKRHRILEPLRSTSGGLSARESKFVTEPKTQGSMAEGMTIVEPARQVPVKTTAI